MQIPMNNPEKLKHISTAVHTQLLKPLGYRKQRNTFNRKAEEGIIQVINLQASMYNIESPESRKVKEEMLGPVPAYGTFFLNFGIWISEIAEAQSERYGDISDFVPDYRCQIRTRIGSLLGNDVLLSLDGDLDTTTTEVLQLIKDYGLSFLEEFETRSKILAKLESHKEDRAYWIPTPLVDASIMYLHQGDKARAQELLQKHYYQSESHKSHREYLRKLAEKLELNLHG